ncbi:hypothetical protein CPAR01_05521 [Colletotrichum paranaense]|uniref:Uncharacterized protein n=1 Tax=Colletotrichum paranaense TaxID=1914294 RepID=A0ABQ9SRI7_9PEZI|nr:uncharacterized protein CPAR01_05521 [Colletotrichum paranaense]KAK1542134.1 hypothetical protein CPAR01_05521 [Colletotrichum paranaense]
MCHTLHGNSLKSEMRESSPRLILAVAILAAKYGCALTLTATAEHWLSPRIMNNIAQSGVVHPEKKRLLLATYWFRHERAFEPGSLRMITEISESFSCLANGESVKDRAVALRIATELFFAPIFTPYPLHGI